MSTYRVFNGFHGDGAVCVLCEAASEADAFDVAETMFKADSPKQPRFWNRENFTSEIVELPELGESS